MIYKDLEKIIDEKEHTALNLLKTIVEMNSYTYNKKGVDKVADILSDVVLDLGFDVIRTKNESLGDNLLCKRIRGSGKSVLFVGHMDTVFPPDLGFNEFIDEGEIVKGPGVIDMKGGLVVALLALDALKEVGLLNDIPLTFIFNSDEEIGSPQSKEIIVNEAKKSLFAFVFECAGKKGEIATGRKGKFSANIKAKGQAGHAAFIREKKSAILELAYKTIEIEKLNDWNRGITTNVGLFKGGMGPNSVAEDALIKIDVRFKTNDDDIVLRKKIEQIVNRSFVDGVKSKMDILSYRPPMEQSEGNKRLFNIIKQEALKIDQSIRDEFRNGASDANFISKAGCPVVDGLGPLGDFDHSTKEFMFKKSFRERALLTSVSLIAAYRGFSKSVLLA